MKFDWIRSSPFQNPIRETIGAFARGIPTKRHETPNVRLIECNPPKVPKPFLPVAAVYRDPIGPPLSPNRPARSNGVTQVWRWEKYRDAPTRKTIGSRKFKDTAIRERRERGSSRGPGISGSTEASSAFAFSGNGGPRFFVGERRKTKERGRVVGRMTNHDTGRPKEREAKQQLSRRIGGTARDSKGRE